MTVPRNTKDGGGVAQASSAKSEETGPEIWCWAGMVGCQ